MNFVVIPLKLFQQDANILVNCFFIKRKHEFNYFGIKTKLSNAQKDDNKC